MTRFNCSLLYLAAPVLVAFSALMGFAPAAAAQCGASINGRVGGETTAFTRVDASTLLVAHGSHVELVSIANPNAPAQFSPRRIALLEGPAVKLAMSQGTARAFALLKNGDVQVFSINYFPSVSIQPFATIHSDAVDIAVSGHHVYLANQTEDNDFDPYINSEIEVFDATSNPPAYRQYLDPLTSDYGYDRLVIVGSTLWAGFHELESSIFGVEAFSIANPNSLVRGAAALNNIALGQYARVNALADGSNRLIVGYKRSYSTQALAAVDISNPNAPAWRPYITVNGELTGLATFGTLVRAAFAGQGVYSYNFFDPYNPQPLGLYSDAFPIITQMQVAGGGTDWWAGGPAGLMTMNTINPAAVTARSTLGVVPIAPKVVRQRGNTTVVLDYTYNQLRLFDYTLPEPQQLRSTINLPWYSELVELGELAGGITLACVATKNNPAGDVIAVYDITNPAAPVQRSTITGFRTHLMSISASRMYIFTTASEFKIIELAQPLTPQVRSTTPYGGGYTGYTALASWSNNAAALGTSALGLWLINTTNATAPLVSAVWNPVTGYRVHSLAKGAGVLYVSASTDSSQSYYQSRLESLVVTNIAAPVQRYLHSGTSGAGAQGTFESLTYLPTPAGNFLVGTRLYESDFWPDPYQYNSATIYALGSFFATENVTAPVSTLTLPQAHGAFAPGGAGVTPGGAGAARFLAAADSAGLYQVAMPVQWAPGFAAQPLVDPAICHGASVSFSTLVSANPTAVTYQWRRNDVPVSNGPTPWGSSLTGATDQFLTIDNVRPGDRGAYALHATNTCGTTVSYSSYLTVLSADMGMQGGVPGSDGLFDNNDFIAFIDLFFARNPLADIGRQGGVSGRDFLYDNNDFIVFIDFFFGNCP